MHPQLCLLVFQMSEATSTWLERENLYVKLISNQSQILSRGVEFPSRSVFSSLRSLWQISCNKITPSIQLVKVVWLNLNHSLKNKPFGFRLNKNMVPLNGNSWLQKSVAERNISPMHGKGEISMKFSVTSI